VSFAAISLCVASQRVIPKVSVYFVIDSVRKLLDTPSYVCMYVCMLTLSKYIGKVITCMEKNSYREADDPLTGQETPRPSWNPCSHDPLP
jgi:hypothetical protein